MSNKILRDKRPMMRAGSVGNAAPLIVITFDYFTVLYVSQQPPTTMPMPKPPDPTELCRRMIVLVKAAARGSMPFRVEHDIVISPRRARTGERADA